jgi:hypothetical protein
MEIKMSDPESLKDDANAERSEIRAHNRKIASGDFDMPSPDEIYANARELVKEAAKVIVQGMIRHDSAAADYLYVDEVANWIEDAAVDAVAEYAEAAQAERIEI